MDGRYESQVIHSCSGMLQIRKERRLELSKHMIVDGPFCNGLELKTSGRFHIQLNIDTDDYTYKKQLQIYRQIHGLVCTYISLLCQLRGSRSNDTPNAKSWVLIPLSSKSNQDTLEKWLILALRQEIYKMSLDHLVVPESKKVLNKKTIKTTLMELCQKDTGVN